MHGAQTKKMYVLVRKDLSDTYRMVQGAHALAQYALDFPQSFLQWHNSTIVFLCVRNLKELKSWRDLCAAETRPYTAFCEEDLEYQETALACYDTGDIFRNLRAV